MSRYLPTPWASSSRAPSPAPSRQNSTGPPSSHTVGGPSAAVAPPATPSSSFAHAIGRGGRGDVSPRKAPLPPSPTNSMHSGVSATHLQAGVGVGVGSGYGGYEDRRRAQSFDIPRGDGMARSGGAGAGGGTTHGVTGQGYGQRLGLPAGHASQGMGPPTSPRRANHAGTAGPGGAGLYDTRLLSTTLSQPPPLSPTPTGGSTLSHQSSNNTLSLGYSTHGHGHGAAGAAGVSGTSPSPNSVSGIVLPSRAMLSHSKSTSPVMYSRQPGSTMGLGMGLGSGAGVGAGAGAGTSSASASASNLTAHGEILRGSGVRSVKETLAHSSPNSPWSLLTIHALPVFAGSALKSTMEDLNQLCHNHIVASSQRTSSARLTAVLSSDVRDLVSSGMLTLKSRLEGDESRLVDRMAETWFFFWTHVLCYIEGIFLPFTQIQHAPGPSSSTAALTSSASPTAPPIPVRHIVLSGFLVHILLPLLPRISTLIASPHLGPSLSGSTALPPDPTRTASNSSLPAPATNAREAEIALRRLLQMSLVLSTQAAYSSFYPFSTDDAGIAAARDYEVREGLVELSKSVRRRLDGEMSVDGQSPASASASASARGGGSGLSSERAALQRKASMLGRRRRGWRLSAIPDIGLAGLGIGGAAGLGSGGMVQSGSGQGQGPGQAAGQAGPSGRVSRQHSDVLGEGYGRWGQPNDVDEEDDDVTPGQSLAGGTRVHPYPHGYGQAQGSAQAQPGQGQYDEFGAGAGTGAGAGAAGYGAYGSTMSSLGASTVTPGGTWREREAFGDATPQGQQQTDLARARARAYSASSSGGSGSGSGSGTGTGARAGQEPMPLAEHRRGQRV